MSAVGDTGPPPDRVISYYDAKYSEYESKYGNGPFTHAHTAVFSSQDFPFLHRDVELTPLGLEAIGHLLVTGQTALVRHVVAALPPAALATRGLAVLDCGAGHGGVSLWLALNYGWNVHCVVLSNRQAEHIASWAERLGIAAQIEVELADIHASSVARRDYDVIVAIDSLVQVGRWESSVDLLRGRLRGGGRLVTSDPYIADPDDPFREVFDSHWTSRIAARAVHDAYCAAAGPDGVTVLDLTTDQLPFWALSIAHSTLRLEDTRLEANERKRLTTSRDVHRQMLSATGSGRVVYRLTAFAAG